MSEAELSKSAKRRAAKKARDAGYAAEAAPPETTPEKPKAKAAPKAMTPEPKAKPKEAAKAAAKPKASPKEEPKKPEPKAQPKAKGKAAPEAPKPKEAAKAKAEPKPKAAQKKVEPPPPAPVEPPAPKAKGKAKAEPKAPATSAPKAAAKKAAAKKEEVDDRPERVEVVQPFAIDDGTGGEWEQSTGLSKQAQKRKEKQEQIKKEQEKKVKEQKMIPGMAGNTVPGMAPGSKAASKEDIAAFMAMTAAKGAAKREELEKEQAEKSSLHTATIKVPENKIGIVIGPKGAKIKMIQEKTGVARIDTNGEIFTIAGPQEAVEMAHMAIKELIEKGYCAMAFEDFKEEGVQVHPSTFPDLIGKQGVTIKAFKSEMNVEVTIPEVPKNAINQQKKYKVTLAGKADDVRKAKEVVESIKTYGYHELTHPGQTHEEIEVEAWAYKYLIGKAGSELRHIQNNYKVKVNIPREHSICQNVVVVGGVGDVARAKDYIDNLMWKAHNAPAGRQGQDAAIDPWGEDEEEDWMKDYIYKR